RAKLGPMLGTGCRGEISYTSRDWGHGKGYRAKIRFIPEGWNELKVPTKDIESFAEFIRHYYDKASLTHGEEPTDEHKYGYARLNEAGEVVQVIKRTNPNKKWDWWKVGGRWSGLLHVKDGADASKGKPGAFGWEYDAAGVDQCRVGDLDLDKMRRIACADIEQRYRNAFVDARGRAAGIYWMDNDDAWDRWNKLIVDAGYAEKSLRKRWEVEGKNGAFYQFIDALEASGDSDAVTLRLAGKVGVDEQNGVMLGKTLEQRKEIQPALCAFALLRDGQWFERGQMGWWGVVSNENNGWEVEFAKMLAELPADKWVTVVDCHI
ncbi:MAG: hypothetical protein J0H19_25405, partial [Rhodospirillales bacterium]|nr:hypothetical protein [Rhodospirillales bacterium]